jgi:predicted DNA-binding transcriptional regulator AlpA
MEQRTRTKVVKEMEDRYFRADEVARYLSIGISTVWIKSKNDEDFPKPRKLSERITVWQKSELDDWVNRNTDDVAEKK